MIILRYISISVLLLLLTASFSYAAGPKLKEGKKPPLFTLMNEDGKMVNLEDIIDRPTVVYFTHNACHYCTQIIAMLKRADKKYGRKDLIIIGVNVMAKDKRLIRAYKEELGFIFPMFAGNRGDVLRAFKIHYVPKLVFIDRNKIVNKVIGHYIHTPELEQLIEGILKK